MLNTLQNAISRGPRSAPAIAMTWILAVAIPTALRLMLQPVLGDTMRYATFYPAVMIVTLLLGARGGLTAIVASAFIGDYLFVPPRFAVTFSATDMMGMIVFAFAAGVILLAAALLRQALVELRLGQERERTLNRELQHRVKNNLAVVYGLAFQTAKTTTQASDFYAKFGDRLKALSNAHDLLADSQWSQCQMEALALSAVEPFNGAGAIHVAGPPCVLPNSCCVPLMLCLHELATNAVKHGALSADHGRVSLTWGLVSRGEALDLEARWAESDGPPVSPPSRRGLGSRLLTPQPGVEAVKLNYAADGLVCDLTIRDVTRAASAPAPRSGDLPQRSSAEPASTPA